MDTAPDDIILDIMKRSRISDIFNICRLSKRMNERCQNPLIKRQIEKSIYVQCIYDHLIIDRDYTIGDLKYVIKGRGSKQSSLLSKIQPFVQYVTDEEKRLIDHYTIVLIQELDPEVILEYYGVPVDILLKQGYNFLDFNEDLDLNSPLYEDFSTEFYIVQHRVILQFLNELNLEQLQELISFLKINVTTSISSCIQHNERVLDSILLN